MLRNLRQGTVYRGALEPFCDFCSLSAVLTPFCLRPQLRSSASASSALATTSPARRSGRQRSASPSKRPSTPVATPAFPSASSSSAVRAPPAHVSYRHTLCLTQRCGAGSSRNAGRRERFEKRHPGAKSYSSWKEMLDTEELDIVSVCTYTVDPEGHDL